MRAAVKAFAEDPGVRVFLLSLRAGAAGLTLTAACRVVLLEPALDPATEQQAVARVHRIGQARPRADTGAARWGCGPGGREGGSPARAPRAPRARRPRATSRAPHAAAQTRPVTITRLIIDDSVEGQVRALCEAKQRLLTSSEHGGGGGGRGGGGGARRASAASGGGGATPHAEGPAPQGGEGEEAAHGGEDSGGSEGGDEDEGAHAGEGTALPGVAGAERVDGREVSGLLASLLAGRGGGGGRAGGS